jgi:hypothetical protein
MATVRLERSGKFKKLSDLIRDRPSGLQHSPSTNYPTMCSNSVSTGIYGLPQDMSSFQGVHFVPLGSGVLRETVANTCTSKIILINFLAYVYL